MLPQAEEPLDRLPDDDRQEWASRELLSGVFEDDGINIFALPRVLRAGGAKFGSLPVDSMYTLKYRDSLHIIERYAAAVAMLSVPRYTRRFVSLPKYFVASAAIATLVSLLFEIKSNVVHIGSPGRIFT